MNPDILAAFKLCLTPEVLLVLSCGTLFGTVVGALPGLGTMLAITICLPLTFTMGHTAAIALLLSVMCSSVYGGSISAVLLNTPGTPNSVATGLDGYAMAKKGRAMEALGWVTQSSVLGGLLSGIIFMCLAPQLAKVSAEYGTSLVICTLIIMGLSCITTLSADNPLKGILMGLLGLFIATVGIDSISGESRSTLGIKFFDSGFDMLPICVGLYPVAEVFYRLYELSSKKNPAAVECQKIAWPGLKLWKGRWINLVRSSLIGTFIGILPGAGATPATFMSYATAKKASKFGDRFTKGEPDGLIAAESANNAVTGGALIPTLALGIPGDAITALMLFTLTIHDITPGINLMRDNPASVYAVFISLVLANLLIIPCSIITVRFLGRLISIPEPLLLGFIILLSFIGVYVVRSNFVDIPITLGIGVFAFFLRVFDFPISPIIIGYILGPQLEYRLGQVNAYKGSMGWLEYLLTSPLAVALFCVAVFFLVSPFVKGLILFIRHWKKGQSE